MFKTLKRVVLLSLLLLLGGGIYLAYQVQAPPRVGGVLLKDETPARVTERRAQARALETQVRDLAAQAKRGEHKRFSISATEDELNTLLQDRVKMKNLPVRDLRLGLEANALLMQGVVDYNGMSPVATLQGQVVARNGKIAIDIESLKVGGVPAPGKWRDKIERQITPRLNDALGRVPGRIDRVTIEKGRLTVEGVTD